ncbi:glycerol-3-phosphate acyltransferase [Bacillus sp. CECT 9360]|uniref:glycerol-3-phosphate acyltransferase n=1 Tax=Bacillus sp. CECT 9360 TaxID=2845821 RepID=UPI001E328AD0|nr:glycerol-3-phosphate acyltransferase [Bacillus sp. CECT 9360]CAH0345830.1 Glycerol-3-phosphate acyltransferase [Bacillus sp. CECT 9360]
MIISYALGSVNGAYYVTRFMAGKDIRLLGSGNAGARNAGRQVGKKGFVLTLIIDISKTMLALLIANFLTDGDDMALILGSAAVLLGHLYPVQLRFRGGKGVVVFLSATLFLVPEAILVTGIIMGVGYLLFRKFTVLGLVALSTIPISSYFFTKNWVYIIGLLLLLIGVILSHTKKGTSGSPPSSTTQRSDTDGIIRSYL